MSKRSIQPQSRHHLHLFDEDWEWLEKTYGHLPGMTVSRAIRLIIHKVVGEMKAKAGAEFDKLRPSLIQDNPLTQDDEDFDSDD